MTIADFFAHPAGTIIRFTGIAVAIGQVVNVSLHPSGARFDGAAVVVSAYTASTPGVGPMVKVISLSDPTHRQVVKHLADVVEAN